MGGLVLGYGWPVLTPRGIALALALMGCSTDFSPSITPFPIPVDLGTGPVLVNLETGDEGPLFAATVDTMSPLTVIDSATPGAPMPEQRKRPLTLTLLSAGQGVDPVPRARFGGVSALDIHPCGADEDVVSGYCKVGFDGVARDIQGIVGADVLSRYAVRFAFRDALMTFLPDIAGSDQDRSGLCESVFSGPFYGGGTMIIGGTEISFAGRRIAMGSCFFDSVAEAAWGRVCSATGGAQGVDGLFVVSTGLGITLVTENTYERYRLIHPEALPLASLAAATLHLPSGATAVRLGTMKDLALVGEASETRGPCSERYASDFLTRCELCVEGAADCPCGKEREFCATGAVLELRHEFPVAVVQNSEPTIQALSSDLRPELPEVSGIIGASALEPVIMDVDYPNGRVIARCVDPATCLARPALHTRNSPALVRSCLAQVSPELTTCEPIVDATGTCQPSP